MGVVLAVSIVRIDGNLLRLRHRLGGHIEGAIPQPVRDEPDHVAQQVGATQARRSEVCNPALHYKLAPKSHDGMLKLHPYSLVTARILVVAWNPYSVASAAGS